MSCNVPNHGQVVGAHSNRQKDGKGMGLKAHDLVAYLCENCHDRYDGRTTPGMSHEEWLEALYASVIWLLSEGYLKNATR